MGDLGKVRLGQVLSIATIIVLAADGMTALIAPESLGEALRRTGFTVEQVPAIGLIVLACAIVYAIPRTAMLGAILISGFVGGAICTHVRVGEATAPEVAVCLAIAIAAWGGLYLRDPRLRALIPVRA